MAACCPGRRRREQLLPRLHHAFALAGIFCRAGELLLLFLLEVSAADRRGGRIDGEPERRLCRLLWGAAALEEADDRPDRAPEGHCLGRYLSGAGRPGGAWV